MTDVCSSSVQDPEIAAPVVFRAVKKRKYRKKAESDGDDEQHVTSPVAVKTEANHKPMTEASHSDVSSDYEESVLLEALKKRTQFIKSQRQGVTFRPESFKPIAPQVKQEDSDSNDNGEEATVGGLQPIDKKFARQTGIVGELVNKHMEEYIESQLAKRRLPQGQNSASHSFPAQPKTAAATGARTGSGTGSIATQPCNANNIDGLRASVRGRIMEVDLGDDVRYQNVAMTRLATSRIGGSGAGGKAAVAPSQPAAVAAAAAAAPTTTTIASTNHAASSTAQSADESALERDRLVEEFLRENKLDVYEYNMLAQPDQEKEYQGAADDRIAEKFRREFMEALYQRRRRRAAAHRPAVNGTKRRPSARDPSTILRGPKLGGSRNERAAMRDKLLEQQQAEQAANPQPQRQQRRRR